MQVLLWSYFGILFCFLFMAGIVYRETRSLIEAVTSAIFFIGGAMLIFFFILGPFAMWGLR